MKSAPSLRIVAGRCAGTPVTVTAGSGFVFERTATGQYTILLDPEFTFVAGTASAEASSIVMDVVPINSRQISVLAFTSSTGAAVNASFSFVFAVR